MQVREARADEWDAYRSLRLRALLDSPESFRVLYDERIDIPDEEWEAAHRRAVAADDLVILFAELDELVGMSTARIVDSELQIFGMWVAPEEQGRGLGRALIDASFVWGKIRGATSARLAVTVGNDFAERLYAHAGFEPTGETEPLREGSDRLCAWLERPL
jgi:GNAT superfamily N-acetyltransferase